MSGLRDQAWILALVFALAGGLCSSIPGVAGAATRRAAPAAQAAPADQFVDGIAAVVNKQVITLGQLADKVALVRVQMQQQRVPVPAEAALRHQVLQQMINQALEHQEAARVGLRVSDARVDEAVATVAQRNRISTDQLRQEVTRSGMNWDQYRAELHDQILDDMLRQRFVADNIKITDSDVDAFLSLHEGEPLTPPAPAPAPAPAPPPPPRPERVPYGPELIELAQILVEVPAYASSATVAEKRKKAEGLLRRLKSGANFAGVAAASSDAPQALQGGDMGIRPLKDWPDLFVQAIRNTPPGGISGIIQSGRGFHILKVVRRGYQTRPAPKSKAAAPPPPPPPEPTAPALKIAPDGTLMVNQTHVRHILVKTSKVVDDAKAKQVLEGLRGRVEHGESFAELARRYSEDPSAPQGGDLGWVNPGDTVPAFEKAMDALKVGQVSEPVKTPFGWHLIQVEGRRAKNMADEFRRIQARRNILERRIGPAYEDWLEQLRSAAYIDNRLDKAAGKP